MKIAIVGAGIAGLATSIALRQVGCEVCAFERGERAHGTGAGIALGPNALTGLAALGVLESLFPSTARSELRVVRNWRGQILTTGPFGGGTVARADLRAALLEGAEGVVHFGRRCTAVVQGSDCVSVKFEKGSDEEADALVATDGLWSAIRGQLFDGGKPIYRGATSWRGIAPVRHEIVDVGINESWGRGQRIGLQRMPNGWIYWWATRNAPEGSEEAPRDRKHHVSEMFRAWHEPIQEVIDATEEEIVQTDLYDRNELKHWSIGRVTLAGDAAHAMTPDLGQGAAQAIEDAIALATAIRDEGEVVAAFRAYEEHRRAPAYTIMRRARRQLAIGQLENPAACAARDTAVKVLPNAVKVKLGVRRPGP